MDEGIDVAQSLNLLKRHVFYELLNIVGRVFIMVSYSERVILGSRGFSPEERDNGIVLVINDRMNFSWDDEGITANLIFDSTPQQCYIPADLISVVHSPELNTQFVISSLSQREPKDIVEDFTGTEQTTSGKQKNGVPPSAISEKVVKVDFTRKKKK